MADDSPTHAKRALCQRCGRPPVVCYCAALPEQPLNLRRTRVAVLQHTREQRQRQSISSVPVLANAFDSSLCVLPVDVDGRREDDSSSTLATARTLHDQLLQQLPASAARSILVLFPTADALPLTPPTHHADERDEEPTTLLVAIDGTWTEAKKIVHHLEALWTSLQVRFVTLATAPPSGSIYGELRKEPMEGCVSTLEAVAEALAVLEPRDALDRDVRTTLRHAFQAMVGAQDSFRRRGRAAQEARYGGPKPGKARAETSSASSSTVRSLSPSPRPSASIAQGVVKPYVFYVTRTDVCRRRKLVQLGDERVCTRDEAIAVCREMNADRRRGDRVAALPREAFERQRLQSHEA
ncbi:hypothetical protein ATCC90586_009685 [Pythium insidiosum]|nr:hypothetical protein ATCC90586_009685 [Pythium insidiosum]